MPDMSNGGSKSSACPCIHHKVVPGLVVVFGLIFLLQAVNVLTMQFVSVAWPVVVVAAGVAKLGQQGCKCC